MILPPPRSSCIDIGMYMILTWPAGRIVYCLYVLQCGPRAKPCCIESLRLSSAWLHSAHWEFRCPPIWWRMARRGNERWTPISCPWAVYSLRRGRRVSGALPARCGWRRAGCAPPVRRRECTSSVFWWFGRWSVGNTWCRCWPRRRPICGPVTTVQLGWWAAACPWWICSCPACWCAGRGPTVPGARCCSGFVCLWTSGTFLCAAAGCSVRTRTRSRTPANE